MTNGKRNWRELCLAVANETDGTKLLDLTEELIVALDERKSTGSSHTKMDGSIVDARAESESLPAELLPQTWAQNHTPSASPL